MLRKIFRWFLVLLAVLILLLVGAVIALNAYLNQSKEEILADLAATTGLELTFRDLDITYWETFPKINVTVDSLVIRDTLRSRKEPPLLRTDYLHGRISLGPLLRDTLRFEEFTLKGGSLYLSRDTSDLFNIGNLGNSSPDTDESSMLSGLLPEADWQGLRAELTDFHLTFLDSTKRKHVDVQLNSLRTTASRDAKGNLRFPLQVYSQVGGIAFNTDKGHYLKGAPLSGEIDLTISDSSLIFPLTELLIAGNTYSIQADLPRQTGRSGQVHLGCDQTDFAEARALMHDTLTARLANYHVEGKFPVQALIVTDAEGGKDPRVTAAFRLSGQQVRILQYVFTDVHTSGRFVNRLVPALGGIPGSKKNLRIDLGNTHGYQGQLFVQTARAQVRGTAKGTHLLAPLILSGPASAISKRLGNVDFFFTKGQFRLETHVDASLDDVDDLVGSSDGTLVFRNADVFYQPAEVRFPFRNIQLRKRGKDVSFRVQSKPLKTGFIFDVNGRIDNLTPLLLNRPGQQMRTDVNFHAPRLDWTDFLALFGDEGFFTEEAADTTGQMARTERQRASMKTTLRGLNRAFRPNIDARFDTVAYYDVFALDKFTTGLHFDSDTLVLERTSFGWGDSEVTFGARLGLHQKRETPFRINLQTEHLNLNRLRPALEYFGLQLPAGLDSLPHDLNVSFRHRGRLDDVNGIKVGYNAGQLDFDDGASALFAGDIHYQPGPNGLVTDLHLAGDPQLVNHLFSARNFFFGSGSFHLDLGMVGTPADLQELISKADVHLRIDSTRIQYRPAGVFVPVKHFEVAVSDEKADYSLDLFNDRSRRAVKLHGTLDRLSGFLYPEPERPFRVTTELTADHLHWDDFRDFILTDSSATSQTQTTPDSLDAQNLLSATGSIFSTFRPELRLSIDTFRTGNFLPFTQVRSHLRLQDTTALLIENTGFHIGQGRVNLNARYALDTNAHSPFEIDWQVDSLVLEELLPALRGLDLPRLRLPGTTKGQLTTNGQLRGIVDEEKQVLQFDSTEGHFNFHLTDTELSDWPLQADLGRKLKMRKRFRLIRFADLHLNLSLKDGRLILPRTEVQTTALQLFVEGRFAPASAPDLLVSVPLRNIGRGLLQFPPDTTGYAHAGWKVRLVLEEDAKTGEPKTRFRLGRRKYFKDRGMLEEFRKRKRVEKALRRQKKRQ